MHLHWKVWFTQNQVLLSPERDAEIQQECHFLADRIEHNILWTNVSWSIHS